MVKTISDLGAFSDNVHSPDDTMLLCDLERLNVYDNQVRDTIKLILSENPDLGLKEDIFQLAIYEDTNLSWEERHPRTFCYQADVKEHGKFGYDQQDFALNFITPFLMECGLPVTRNELLKTLDEPLHPAEHAYIQRYLHEPKLLTIYSRDTIRKHFKGCSLHKFLETSDCPQKIKDFVLMKQLLHYTIHSKVSSRYTKIVTIVD